MTTEEEDWPDPGVTSSSFLNPAGPFRPLRRIVTYLTVLALIAVPLGGVIFALDLGPGLILSVYAGGAVGTLFTAWAALWILDTILAFLKR